MSRFKKGRNFPGADMSWDTEGGGGGEADGAPTPLYPVSLMASHLSLSLLLPPYVFSPICCVL